MSSVRSLHAVVTCSELKRFEVPQHRRLSTVELPSLDARFDEWLKRLAPMHGEASVPARDLYSGSHWSAVQALPRMPEGSFSHLDIWVASAGYGLIHESRRVLPYAATFATGQDDSVALQRYPGRAEESNRRWWTLLTQAQRGTDPSPRSITELAQQQPASTILIAVSVPYLKAMRADILTAAAELQNHEQLSVICSGAAQAPTPRLDLHMVPSSARLKALVGGSMQELNVRLLRYALEHREETGLQASGLQSHFQELLDKSPQLDTHDRNRMSDAEVQAFIQGRLEARPDVGHTPLLRELRDSGRACEQKRFRTLYEQVVSNGTA